MSDKVDKIIEALGEDGISELLERLTEAKKKQPSSEDGVIKLNSQTDAAQPDEQKRTRVFQPVSAKNRKNKFFDMPESKMYKNDTKSFDKKVWEGNEASSRKRQVQKYSINCSKCGKEYIITNLSQVYKDPDSGEYVYTCDNCIPRPAN